MDLISVPVIVLVCYLLGELYKVLFIKKQETYKLIPIVVTLLGGIMGIVIYLTNQEIMGVNNIYDALLIGLISGATSTGANQVIKQIIKKEGDVGDG